jgi:hypothetical protein
MAHRPLLTTVSIAAAFLASSALAGCGDDDPPAATATSASTATASQEAPTTVVAVINPDDGGDYSPTLDPASFVDVIDNPYLPMPVGAHWRYEGESEGEIETVEVSVTGDRKTIMGISAFVVRDTVTIDGELVEDTYDWFAQDADGNVWYLGEDSKEYENGVVTSTEGSWEAGVDGALPGIVMPAAPAPGDVYRQEFYAGEAEDMMEIVSVDARLSVPAGEFADVVMTKDWTPLEPATIEEKAYAPGVGKIREAKSAGGDGFAELVEYTLGG